MEIQVLDPHRRLVRLSCTAQEARDFSRERKSLWLDAAGELFWSPYTRDYQHDSPVATPSSFTTSEAGLGILDGLPDAEMVIFDWVSPRPLPQLKFSGAVPSTAQPANQIAMPAGTGALGQLIACYQGHSGPVNALAWSPDGKCIASGGYDRTVQIWEAANGTRVRTLHGHRGTARTLDWSCDGSIASAGDDTTVQVWDVSSAQAFLSYTHPYAISCVAWSPAGTHLVGASQDGVVLWDIMANRRPQFIYHAHSMPVWSSAWSPDGRYLASGGEDTTVHVWDAANGNSVQIHHVHRAGVHAVTWMPWGQRIASAGDDQSVQVLTATSAKTLTMYQCHAGKICSVAWAPSGKWIASAGEEGTVHIWEALTGRRRYTYHGHTDAINGVAWSPDGTLLASASSDQSIHVWRAT